MGNQQRIVGRSALSRGIVIVRKDSRAGIVWGYLRRERGI